MDPVSRYMWLLTWAAPAVSALHEAAHEHQRHHPRARLLRQLVLTCGGQPAHHRSVNSLSTDCKDAGIVSYMVITGMMSPPSPSSSQRPQLPASPPHPTHPP
jgi:hypothetical protein